MKRVSCIYTAAIRVIGAPKPVQERDFGEDKVAAERWLDQQKAVAERRGWNYSFELNERCKVTK